MPAELRGFCMVSLSRILPVMRAAVSQTTYVEVVKGCPPSNRVPFATFVNTVSWHAIGKSAWPTSIPSTAVHNAAALCL
jgi:hypothetical protein